jgi:hypothetical protein
MTMTEAVLRTSSLPGAYDEDTPYGSIVKPAELLASFEVLSLIGAEGMGDIYEERDLRPPSRAVSRLATRIRRVRIGDVKANAANRRKS